MGRVTVALIALLMLSYASVRSTVMQVVGMPSTCAAAVCDDPGMNGMSMPGMSVLATTDASHNSGHSPAPSAAHHAVCPYCSVAANPLAMADVAPVRIPASVVFVAFHPVESHGPRGPPALDARARGPPVDLTPA